MQDASSKQQIKQKHKPNYQQTGLPPHSALPIRRKTNKQTKTQHKSYPIQAHTNHWTNLMREEIKRKKEFNPEVGKRRPQIQCLKKKKAEKYYTNEGLN